MKNLFLLLGVDFCSGLFNWIMLWKFCNINILKVLKKIQNEYWLIMTVLEGRIMFEVSSNLASISFPIITKNQL